MTVRDNTSMAADPITPEGLGRSLMVVTIVMTVLASAAVAGRLYVRIIYNALAVDDWLMLAGWVSTPPFVAAFVFFFLFFLSS